LPFDAADKFKQKAATLECFSNGRKKQLHGVTHHTLSIPIHDL